MIAYASRTGTRRNLDALRDAGWRLLVSARGVLRTEGFPYALDNGAWTAFQKREPFNVGAFVRAVERLGSGADFVVVPDIVEGGRRSLDLSISWLPRLRGLSLVIAVQDGMEGGDVRGIIGRDVGIFVGGSTGWKESTMRTWSTIAHEAGGRCHVGRVNSMRRIRLCHDAAVDSFDGTSASKYSVTLDRLDRAVRQPSLLAGCA